PSLPDYGARVVQRSRLSLRSAGMTVRYTQRDSGLSPMSLRALLFRRPPDPQLIEVAFDGTIFPVQLRRHRQARRYTLRVQAANRTVVLTMPLRGSVKEARAFAER